MGYFLKMLTYLLCARLFRKHRALPATPSLALKKVDILKAASAAFIVECIYRLESCRVGTRYSAHAVININEIH